MISRREIIDASSALSLLPQVVEKDYILGWVIDGINHHPALADTWIFKGGTCLKKCFFETYRFSEDLDFTLRDAAHIDPTFLTETFTEVAEWVYDRTGIELPPDLHTFEVYRNPRGNPSCQGKLSYRGPIAPKSGGLPRIRSYRVDRIQEARITSLTFVPRHAVELSSIGPLIVRPTASRSSGSSRRIMSPRWSNSSSGHRYIYQCPVCGKRSIAPVEPRSAIDAPVDLSTWVWVEREPVIPVPAQFMPCPCSSPGERPGLQERDISAGRHHRHSVRDQPDAGGVTVARPRSAGDGDAIRDRSPP